MNAAHTLFADHLMEWSEEFAMLYQKMYEIYCAATPMPEGRYRTTSIGIGYSSFPVTRWMADKVQSPVPAAKELVARFDRLISEYSCCLVDSSDGDRPGGTTRPLSTLSTRRD